MASKIKFYTAIFFKNGEKQNYDFGAFLDKINEITEDKKEKTKLLRSIDDTAITAFKSHINNDNVVVPIGKLKQKSKPYHINKEGKLREIDIELFDLALLGYNKRMSLAMITVNRQAPSIEQIEQYFETFIPEDMDISVKIKPIFRMAGIEKIRNAKHIRSVVLTLNLGEDIEKAYQDKIKCDKCTEVMDSFKKMITIFQKDIKSRTFSMEIGIGRLKKETLDKDSVLEIIESLNIKSDIIKEITVKYKGDKDEKVDVAKLKNYNIGLSQDFNVEAISPEYLISNMENISLSKRADYIDKIEDMVKGYNNGQIDFELIVQHKACIQH